MQQTDTTGAAVTVRSTDIEIPRSVLAIGAHPDDIEFGCGATVAKWAEAGATVHFLILTDGSKGTWDANADIPALIARRSTEAVAAARALGATGEVINLGRVDGELDSSLVERGEVAFHIRRLQPQIVLGHDPWKTYRLHPDHRHAGYLAVEGIVAARDPHFFKEHGIPHLRPEALLLFEAEAPNHLESVEDRHLEARVQALLAHESQLETTHYHRLDDPSTQAEGFRVRERAVLAAMAEPFGEAIGEAFRLMDDL